MLNLILGGAALQRCGYLFLSAPVLAAEVRLQRERHFFPQRV